MNRNDFFGISIIVMVVIAGVLILIAQHNHQLAITKAMQSKNLTALLKTGCVAIYPDYTEVLCGTVYQLMTNGLKIVGT